ncbi:MAG TPA: hypothetical protein VNN62_22030 [Methylomirabilota bacterium]|jgi:isocitrate dehydrogenase|nr:hypothetical protein [Methylomirabilota bacterium]HZP61079.1 hypothetical protein [Opitutaceae bacterium]
MASHYIQAPQGEKISLQNGKLNVPDHPIAPFIERGAASRLM